mmetsp:Transcript_88414/g.156784  ORF Transcript_88414/g.156784 Transcript_88414/m.156784 type:complete len:536 (-) Transcript_88414:159-1766(-)
MANTRAPAMVFGAAEGLGLTLGDSHGTKRDEASLTSSPLRASTGSGMWSPFSQFSAVAVNSCASPFASCTTSPERRLGQAEACSSERKKVGRPVEFRSHSAGKLNAKGRHQLEQRLAEAESQVQRLVKENAGLRKQLGVPGEACREKPGEVVIFSANSTNLSPLVEPEMVEGEMPRTAKLVETFLEELSRCRQTPQKRKSFGLATVSATSLAARLDQGFQEFCGEAKTETNGACEGVLPSRQNDACDAEMTASGSRKLMECSSVESQLDRVMIHCGSAVIKHDAGSKAGDTLRTPPPRRRVTLSRPGEQTARSPRAAGVTSPESVNHGQLEASADNSSVLRLSASSTASVKEDLADQGDHQENGAGPVAPLLRLPRSFATASTLQSEMASMPDRSGSSWDFLPNPPLQAMPQQQHSHQQDPQPQQHQPRQTTPVQMQVDRNVSDQDLHRNMPTWQTAPTVTHVYLAAAGAAATMTQAPVKHIVRSRSLGDAPVWFHGNCANPTQATPCYSPCGVAAVQLSGGGSAAAGCRYPSTG